MTLRDALRPHVARAALGLWAMPGQPGPGRESRAAMWREYAIPAFDAARAIVSKAAPEELAELAAESPEAVRVLCRKRCGVVRGVAALAALAIQEK